MTEKGIPYNASNATFGEAQQHANTFSRLTYFNTDSLEHSRVHNSIRDPWPSSIATYLSPFVQWLHLWWQPFECLAFVYNTSPCKITAGCPRRRLIKFCHESDKIIYNNTSFSDRIKITNKWKIDHNKENYIVNFTY